MVLTFARENPTCGCDRIAEALGNLAHSIPDQTIKRWGTCSRRTASNPRRTGS